MDGERVGERIEVGRAVLDAIARGQLGNEAVDVLVEHLAGMLAGHRAQADDGGHGENNSAGTQENALLHLGSLLTILSWD